MLNKTKIGMSVHFVSESEGKPCRPAVVAEIDSDSVALLTVLHPSETMSQYYVPRDETVKAQRTWHLPEVEV